MKPQTLLKILLVLSIISAVTSFFGELTMALCLPMLDQFYSAHPEILEEFRLTATWEVMVRVPRAFYAIMAVLWAASLTGCLLMWKLRRAGFHCYTIAQLLMIPMPVLFLDKSAMNIGNIMFTALFVFYYWRLLKTLSPETPESLDSPESPETPETPESPEPSESSD